MSETNLQVTQNAANEVDIYNALKNSIYPGAKDESIKMVMSYCKAYGVDPLLKPVHIIPMSVKDAKSGRYEYRDVIMPGISLYRMQAERSGFYAGMSEPEFGPDITEDLGGIKVTYPQWAKVTVRKFVQGIVVEFTAKEIWKENYATKDKNSSVPNMIWLKRPYGQIAKCAEAQALRKAFPSLFGQNYTYEEMEGKVTIEPKTEKPLKLIMSEECEELISDETYELLTNLIETLSIEQIEINAWMKRAKVDDFKMFPEEKALKLVNSLKLRANKE